MTFLPKGLHRSIKCQKNEELQFVLDNYYDIRMVSLATVEIWDNLDTIKSYVYAGGVITAEDLSCAVANLSTSISDIMNLIPDNIFDNISNPPHSIYARQGSHTVLIRYVSTLFVLLAEMLSSRHTCTKILDLTTILDKFYDPHKDHSQLLAVKLLGMCFTIRINNNFEFLETLNNRFNIEHNKIVIGLCSRYQDRTANVDTESVLKFIQSLDLDVTCEKLAADCVWLPLPIIQYLSEIGFDLVSNVNFVKRSFDDRFQFVPKWLAISSIEKLVFLKEIGINFTQCCDALIQIVDITSDFISDKIIWLLDNVFDPELETEQKKLKEAAKKYRYATADLKSKLGC
jgi:hypothetical protein